MQSSLTQEQQAQVLTLAKVTMIEGPGHDEAFAKLSPTMTGWLVGLMGAVHDCNRSGQDKLTILCGLLIAAKAEEFRLGPPPEARPSNEAVQRALPADRPARSFDEFRELSGLDIEHWLMLYILVQGSGMIFLGIEIYYNMREAVLETLVAVGEEGVS